MAEQQPDLLEKELQALKKKKQEAEDALESLQQEEKQINAQKDNIKKKN